MIRRQSSSSVNDIKNSLKRKSRDEPKGFIPTGLVPLNLALSDTYLNGFREGCIVNIVGDSHTGKSILALSILAELANNSEYDDYRLVYDDAEFANNFDMEYLFGKTASKRIIPPQEIKGEPANSETIQEFIANVNRELKKGPFVYILDSLDSVTSDEEMARYDKYQKETDRGKKSDALASSYKTEKPKYMSELLRIFRGRIKKTKSVLIIVSQTRDNINAIGFSDKKTRTGGKALEFYCLYIMWLAHKKQIKNPKFKKVIGNDMTIKVTKNKYNGKRRSVDATIYYDLGVDNVGAMVDFLVNEGHWKKQGAFINAKEMKVKKTKKELVKFIESNNKERAIAKVCQHFWEVVEEELRLSDRKRRYVG